MAAFRRYRTSHIQKGKRRRQRKTLSRRRRLHSTRRRKMRTKRRMRFSRSTHRRRHFPISRYFTRQRRTYTPSARKIKRTMSSSYRDKTYHRKPLRVGRPRKRRTCQGYLKDKLKKMTQKKCTRGRKPKRQVDYSDDNCLYSLADPSMKAEERQPRKQSVRFASSTNAKAKETGPQCQEDASCDTQSSQQQTMTTKRRRAASGLLRHGH